MFCLLTFAVLVVVLPILMEAKISVNPMLNIAVVAIYIFKIKVFCKIAKFEKGCIKLSNEKGTKVKELKLKGGEIDFLKKFGQSTIDKMKLKKVYVIYNVGLGDAFSTAMLCGHLNLFLDLFFVYLKNKKPTATLEIFDNVSYNNNVGEIALKCSFSICLLDLFGALVYALSTKIAQRRVYYNT